MHSPPQPRCTLHRQHVGQAGEGTARAEGESPAGARRAAKSLCLPQVRHRVGQVDVHGHAGGDGRAQHVWRLASVRAGRVHDGDCAFERSREGCLIAPVELKEVEAALREPTRPLAPHLCQGRLASGAIAAGELDGHWLGTRDQMRSHGGADPSGAAQHDDFRQHRCGWCVRNWHSPTLVPRPPVGEAGG